MKLLKALTVVVIIVAIFMACNFAWDNDPNFMLSNTWTGRVQSDEK
jgi:hypothetical protein